MSDQIITLLAAFGLGSVMTALVQSWLETRRSEQKRRFDEVKAAYVGLLDAYHKAAVQPSEAAAKEFGYWQMRCELVASDAVIAAIADIIETNDHPLDRAEAHDRLKIAMRKDLKIAK